MNMSQLSDSRLKNTFLQIYNLIFEAWAAPLHTPGMPE